MFLASIILLSILPAFFILISIIEVSNYFNSKN